MDTDLKIWLKVNGQDLLPK